MKQDRISCFTEEECSRRGHSPLGRRKGGGAARRPDAAQICVVLLSSSRYRAPKAREYPERQERPWLLVTSPLPHAQAEANEVAQSWPPLMASGWGQEGPALRSESESCQPHQGEEATGGTRCREPAGC